MNGMEPQAALPVQRVHKCVKSALSALLNMCGTPRNPNSWCNTVGCTWFFHSVLTRSLAQAAACQHLAPGICSRMHVIGWAMQVLEPAVQHRHLHSCAVPLIQHAHAHLRQQSLQAHMHTLRTQLDPSVTLWEHPFITAWHHRLMAAQRLRPCRAGPPRD